MRKVSLYLGLILYYGIARHLPSSTGFGFRHLRKLSRKIRYIVCRLIFKKMGRNVNVEHGAYFGKGDRIEIGDNSGIGIHCHIHPNTIIGANVMMGPNCYMLNSVHKHDRTDIPMIQQGRVPQRPQVIIEDDVWIGQDVLIMSSKTIKKGSIIAARCVLTRNFPEFSIIGGNPSRLLKSRIVSDNVEQLLQQ